MFIHCIQVIIIVGNTSYTCNNLKLKDSRNTNLDSVIEKLQRYADYLQRQLDIKNKRKSGRINGFQPDQKRMADDVELERRRGEVF
jgi:hypothetical protein